MIFKDNDKQHIKFSYITHFYCNQSNMDSVENLLRKYEKMPLDIRSVVEFVIVDDGSPINYNIQQFDLNITWLKIKENIKWNQAGARNLGVVYAKSDKILITDMDCEINQDGFRYLINTSNPGRNFYKIHRYNEEQKKMPTGHPNVFFMSRARYLRFYGYDEQFSGNYGYEDLYFVKWQKWHGSKQKYLPKHVILTERKLDRNNSYHSLSRDQEENEMMYLQKRKESCDYGYEYGYSRLFLNFTFEMLYQNSLFPASLPKVNTSWRLIWWLRYLFPFMAK